MSLSKLQEIVKDREAWRAAVHGCKESDTVRLSDWTITTQKSNCPTYFVFSGICLCKTFCRREEANSDSTWGTFFGLLFVDSVAGLEDPAPPRDCELSASVQLPEGQLVPAACDQREEHSPSKAGRPWRCSARGPCPLLPTASPSPACLLTVVPYCFFLSNLWKNLASRYH